MMKLLLLLILSVCLLLLNIDIFAVTNISQVANNLTIPFLWAKSFLSAGSIALGVSFLVSGIFRFFRFRQNPQESPLSSVIILIILGIALLIIPLSYKFSKQLAQLTGAGETIAQEN